MKSRREAIEAVARRRALRFRLQARISLLTALQADGTINLGLYGSVYVDNLTVPQAKAVIEYHLSQFLVNPEISLDVAGFNSRVFYVISDGSPNPYRYRVRAPSFVNLTILEDMCLGHHIADVVIILGSIDIVLGEVDR